MKGNGLRRRWLINIASMVCALGMVFALGITAYFAAWFYSDVRAELRLHAQMTSEVFEQHREDDRQALYEQCIAYVDNFSRSGQLQLQFLDINGLVMATSEGDLPESAFMTSDIIDAVKTRGIGFYAGKDPLTGERVMAASCPVISVDGEVIGVFRHVSVTATVNWKITVIGMISLGFFLMFLAAVLLLGNFYNRNVVIPVTEITEKARRIANGSYGVQIQTRYADEVGELAETINELSAKISQNEKMQAEFISQLSHELRTPLTAINGWSETLLADENMDPDTQQGMKIISREAKRLTEMVMDLLDFTRMQDGRMTLHVEPTDIRSEFEDTVFMYGSRLSQEGIELDYIDTDEDIPEIPCDPQRLRQVFLNILDNAAKHGGEGKRIEATMSYEDGVVVVRIRDFGPGIPEDEIPLVKKKFYKGSSKARGTGIGLAVCDEIVQMHGGELILDNAPGGGTIVTVKLPDAQ